MYRFNRSILPLLTLCLVVAGAWWIRAQLKLAPQALLEQLFREDVSYQFHSYAAQISGKQSLLVAKLEQVEVIERASQKTALWLQLPEVVTRLEVPVEYNFFISLSADWKFSRAGDELVVFVPEISSGTPAANMSLLKLEVTSGNFIFNEESAKKKLLSEVHTLLIENSIQYREKVREEARQSLMQFVQNWIVQMGETSAPIKVRILFPVESTTRPRS